MLVPAQDLLKRAAREHGLLLAITVLSVLASLIQLFVDVSTTISVKWLLFSVLVMSWMIAVLLQALAMVVSDRQLVSGIGVIGTEEDGEVLVVKSTASLSMNTLVSVYVTSQGHEVLSGIGYVQNVQANGITSVRMQARYKAPGKRDKLIVKTTLPHDKIQVVPHDR